MKLHLPVDDMIFEAEAPALEKIHGTYEFIPYIEVDMGIRGHRVSKIADEGRADPFPSAEGADHLPVNMEFFLIWCCVHKKIAEQFPLFVPDETMFVVDVAALVHDVGRRDQERVDIEKRQMRNRFFVVWG